MKICHIHKLDTMETRRIELCKCRSFFNIENFEIQQHLIKTPLAIAKVA